MIDFAITLLLPLFPVSIVILLLITKSEQYRHFLFGCLHVTLLAYLIFWAAWCWILRDGLGPDSVESHGRGAWARFFGDVWPVLAFVSLIALIGYLSNQYALRRIHKQ
jgi:hypothetical protein